MHAVQNANKILGDQSVREMQTFRQKLKRWRKMTASIPPAQTRPQPSIQILMTNPQILDLKVFKMIVFEILAPAGISWFLDLKS